MSDEEDSPPPPSAPPPQVSMRDTAAQGTSPSRLREAASVASPVRLRFSEGGQAALSNHQPSGAGNGSSSPQPQQRRDRSSGRPREAVAVASKETQTNISRRHRDLGIVWKGHSMSRIAVFLSFWSPVMTLLSGLSYYMHWKPHFVSSHANDRQVVDDIPALPTFLSFLCASIYVFLVLTYGVVLPSCYRALTARPEVVNEWSHIVIAALAYALAAAFVTLGEVLCVLNLSFGDPAVSLLSLSNIVLCGASSYVILWYVYTVSMADSIQRRARRVADEYLRHLRATAGPAAVHAAVRQRAIAPHRAGKQSAPSIADLAPLPTQ